MKAITFEPGRANTAQLDDRPEPAHEAGGLLVATHAIGVCGTDRELLAGAYGTAPPGEQRLVIGHESIGRVVEAAGDFKAGDWVVGIVRKPDPEPCANCGVGEWDMCRNGKFTEHGIKQLHGFASERYRIDPAHAVHVDPSLGELGVLIEPTSVVAKAWEHIERIGQRALFEPRTVLVTGAGPIGLLAALLGQQRGLEVHVLDRATDGAKPALVRALGGHYHAEPITELKLAPDIVIECTGAAPVIIEAISLAPANAIVCLTGVSARGISLKVDVGAVNRDLVLDNNVVFGSVNANRRHYEAAASALAKADRSWLERLVTRRVPLARWSEALERRPGDIKTVIVFDD